MDRHQDGIHIVIAQRINDNRNRKNALTFTAHETASIRRAPPTFVYFLSSCGCLVRQKQRLAGWTQSLARTYATAAARATAMGAWISFCTIGAVGTIASR